MRAHKLSLLRFILPVLGIGVSSLGLPQSEPGKAPRLYVVGYSHLDTQWCWTYPQVVREFIPNTLHENFALFEKYPNYVFNWTGTNRYRFIKDYYPEDYAKLKEYIKKGRWFTAGSSVEEGDVNSPSEESLIRQVMYGNQFSRREFGTESSEYMLPDCFGFPASLPSILAHCGLKGFSTQKLSWGSAMGIPFNVGRWVGPDGKYIVAALNATSYTSNVDDDLSRNSQWMERVKRNAVPVDFRYYGSGDRGGAPQEDSVKRLEATLSNQGPLQIIAGRADNLFNQLTPAEIGKLKSYQGDLELTQHSAGSLTSEAAMKRWNRKNEVLAEAAEKSSVMAAWLGELPYDQSRITDGWLRFLPGQFHDLMAGTALPLAYNYTWNDEVIAMNEFADVIQGSVGSIARGLDTRGAGVPLVVYNPLGVAREDTVSAQVRFSGNAPSEIRIIGFDGKSVPAQLVSREGNTAQILFSARVLPLSVTTFHVQSGRPEAGKTLKVSKRSLENARYRVTLDTKGDIGSVFDKLAKKELLKGPARLAYQYEKPKDWPAWNMDWEDQSKAPRGYVDSAPTIKIVENGAARVALEVTRVHAGSTFVQTIRLSAGSAGERVEIELQADWRGTESVLKAEFPLTVSNSEATYNWELGTVRRKNNDPKKYEVASHRWFDLTDRKGDYGVSILDDCKYGSDKPSDNLVRLSLLYTPGTRDGYQHQGSQDFGHHEVLYGMYGHAGNWTNGSQWQAARLNQPLIGFQVATHSGSQGKKFSLAQISNPNLALSTIKLAEDSEDLIVRVNELSGKSQAGVVTFAGDVVSAREVDGQERPIGGAEIKGGKLMVSTTAYHPRAYAIRLAKSKNRNEAGVCQPVSLPYDTNAWKDFDGKGRALPASMVPASLVSGGLRFDFAPKSSSDLNAVACNGQKLAIPAGIARTISFLVASTAGDVQAEFRAGAKAVPARIQAWDGYVGQWDTRIWEGQVQELTYGWDPKYAGLIPGYIKRAPIAWYADHRKLADGTNDIYAFSYLFRLDIPISASDTEITLPNNPAIKILAATLGNSPVDEARPVQPLYDVRIAK